MWLKIADCERLISENWTGDRGLLSNLGQCKVSLINWDKQTFGNVRLQARRLEDEIQSLQQSPLNAQVRQRLTKAKLELEVMLDKEELLWKQRSKVQWLAEGDRNTWFFHAQATRRARRNAIKGLRNQQGLFCEDQLAMAEIVNGYYSEIFKSKQPSIADMERVIQTMEELERLLMRIFAGYTL